MTSSNPEPEMTSSYIEPEMTSSSTEPEMTTSYTEPTPTTEEPSREGGQTKEREQQQGKGETI